MTSPAIILFSRILPFLKRLLLAGIKLFESPIGAGLIAFLVYSIISIWTGRFFSISRFPYYNYLADAFLHGNIWFRLSPPDTHDLIFFQGKYSIYQAPLPAIIIMPLVLIFGVGLSDVVYNLLFASVNIGLLAYFLRLANRNKIIDLSKAKRAILICLFMVGSVYFTQVITGRVWNTALILGFTFVLLAYIFAFTFNGKKAWFLTGLAISAAMLTRNHLVFTGIFPIVYLLVHQRPKTWLYLFKNFSLAALPVAIGLGIILAYNQLRFGNPVENGIKYHLMAPFFFESFQKYGAFNFHYVPINIYYQYFFYPLPLRADSAMGGSLFLLSPLFFGIFTAFIKRNRTWHSWVLLLTILITNIPILLLMGTGWTQFGPRYTLDFSVPLLLLTAIGIQSWKTPLMIVFTVISIIQYFLGFHLWAHL